MKKFLSLVLMVSMIISVLAACGSNVGKNNINSEKKVEEGSSVESGNKSEYTSKEEKTQWPKRIVDAKGNEVVLESKPERITLLHTFYTEHFLALELYPTAVALGNANGQVQVLSESELYKPYLGDANIMDIGKANALNLEKIIESKPDVIITYGIHRGLDEVYDQLKAIAPVILLNYQDSWQDQLRACAEIVDKTKEAEDVINDIQLTIDEAKEVVSKHADRSFGLFRTDGKGFIPIATADYFETFGLVKPNMYPDNFEPMSLEGIVEMNPYYIVFQHNYEAATAFVDSMSNSSVWNSLDAVKNKRIYFFDENMNTKGPLAMKLTAEKLKEIYNKE